MVLAVPSRDITDAWLSALPGVGIAGGIALPFAILAAVIIARQVARPIHELTLASEAMALGDFDQRVEVARAATRWGGWRRRFRPWRARG